MLKPSAHQSMGFNANMKDDWKMNNDFIPFRVVIHNIIHTANNVSQLFEKSLTSNPESRQYYSLLDFCWKRAISSKYLSQFTYSIEGRRQLRSLTTLMGASDGHPTNLRTLWF